MRKILCLLFLISVSLQATDIYPEDKGLAELVKKQRLVHSKDIKYMFHKQLINVRHNIERLGGRPLSTYLFWSDGTENSYWLRAFIKHMKKDLAVLGVDLKDRIALRTISKDENINNIKEAERYILLGTKDTPFFKDDKGYKDFTREWDIIKSILNVDKHSPGFTLTSATNPPIILPLRVDGNCSICPEECLELYADYFYKEMRIANFDYMKLIVTIAKFAHKFTVIKGRATS